MAPVSARKPPRRKGSMAHVPDNILEHIKDLEQLFTIGPEALKKIVDDFIGELEKGLRGDEGHDIPMIPTWVQGYAKADESGSYLAIDMGGTNIRVCEITIEGNGKYDLLQAKYRIPEKLKHGERDPLFDHIATCVKKFLDDHHEVGDLDMPLGFTFSYPCSQDAIDHGVLQRWTKGFDVNDVEGVDVVPVFNKALEKQGLKIRCSALINDTTGTLIASNYVDPEMQIAVIFGTGCNAAYMETIEHIPKLHSRGFEPSLQMAINCEWGAFPLVPRTNYDALIDEQSPRPGQQKFEKMIAGLYLGEIARQVIVDYHGRGQLFQGQNLDKLSEPYSLETAVLSDIETDPNENLIDTQDIFEKKFGIAATLPELQLIRRLAELIGTRSARLSAAGVAAICKKKGIRKCHVGADGSVYAKYPHFRERGAQALRDIFGKDGDEIKILPAEDGSGVGAALISAVVKRMQKEGKQVSAKGTDKTDHDFMRKALEQARRSTYVDSAYCVGCVLVANGQILSTGYSRELPGNTHAEQCALHKLDSIEAARGATVYTTMEPCSLRLSGNASCVSRLLQAGVARVVQAVSEPPDFVEACTGAEQLREAGITVDFLPEFAAEATDIARGRVGLCS
ncbi:hexokinase [Savitreella phatthalungensis]